MLIMDMNRHLLCSAKELFKIHISIVDFNRNSAMVISNVSLHGYLSCTQ